MRGWLTCRASSRSCFGVFRVRFSKACSTYTASADVRSARMTRCSASSSEKPLIQIQKVVTARRLKQVQLAKLLQVSQPRISDLLRGRLHLFSIETLIDMLGRLGVQVRLVVKPTRLRQVA